jgi:hypothetical protein
MISVPFTLRRRGVEAKLVIVDSGKTQGRDGQDIAMQSLGRGLQPGAEAVLGPVLRSEQNHRSVTPTAVAAR